MTVAWTTVGRRSLIKGAVALVLALSPPLGTTVATSAADRDGASDRSLNPLRSLEPGDLGGFRNKPLFTPSRQPPPVTQRRPDPPAMAPPAGGEPPKVRLTGIVDGVSPMAILWRANGSTSTAVRLGDDVDGWLVTSIASLSIMLKNGPHEQEYKLFSRDPGPVGAPEATTPKPRRRIDHPTVDIGRNLRAKAPS